MFRNLNAFLEAVKKEGELAIIDAPVDPYLELAEIHRRVIEQGGPVLLFTNVKGSKFPVVTNLFGTIRRVDLAFGPRPEQFMRRIVKATDTLVPPTPKKVWEQRDLIWGLSRVGTKTVSQSQAPVLKHVLKENPMAQLPVLTSWQLDGGPFVTLPLVYTEHPETKAHNLGMYRMHVYDGQTSGMHWQIGKGGGFHHAAAEELDKPLPVTVFLGGPPALIASAIAPVPEHLPELMLTSLIMGEKLQMAENPLGAHKVVAEAEFAIYGQVPPHVRRMEGPFGDHFGYYSWAHEFPVFNIDHVWHRENAIYPATIVGKPRQEDYYLGDFLQRLLSPAFPMAMPAVRDLWTYAESGFHPLASAVVRESYSREALTSAFRILGEGQLSLTKFLIVTDRTVDLSDFTALMELVLERFDPRTDLFVMNHTSHDTLDYTGRQLNHGSKAILMGVGKEPIRKLPTSYTGGPLEGVTQVQAYGKGMLVVSGRSYVEDEHFAARILERHADELTDWPLIFVVDDAEAVVQNQTSFLWTTFTRFNPATDMFARSGVNRHHLHYELPIIIDARMKPDYPDELFPREDIVELVDRRWQDYFPKA
jgi:UbiD family decarboxylase